MRKRASQPSGLSAPTSEGGRRRSPLSVKVGNGNRPVPPTPFPEPIEVSRYVYRALYVRDAARCTALARDEEGCVLFGDPVMRFARVRLLGLIVEASVSDTSLEYSLDDGTGTIRITMSPALLGLTTAPIVGDTVEFIGDLQDDGVEATGFTHVTDPNIEVARWLEVAALYKDEYLSSLGMSFEGACEGGNNGAALTPLNLHRLERSGRYASDDSPLTPSNLNVVLAVSSSDFSQPRLRAKSDLPDRLADLEFRVETFIRERGDDGDDTGVSLSTLTAQFEESSSADVQTVVDALVESYTLYCCGTEPETRYKAL